MSHILKNPSSQSVGKRYCAATAKVKGNQLILQNGVSVIKEDTMIAELLFMNNKVFELASS